MSTIPKTRIIELFEKFKQNGGYCFVLAFTEKDKDGFECEALGANINNAYVASYLEIEKLSLLKKLKEESKNV